MKFSDVPRTACPAAQFDAAEQLHERATGLLVPVLRRADLSRVPMHYALPFKARILFQAGLRRCLQLAEGTGSELNSRRYMSAFLLARGCLETACVVYDALLRIAEILDSPSREKLEALSEYSLKAAFGARSKRWLAAMSDGTKESIEELTIINVVTIVERVGKSHPLVLTLFEDLSEHCHPNCAGMVGGFTSLDENAQEERFQDPWDDAARAALLDRPVNAVALSLELIVTSIETLEAELPKFVRITEEALFREGKWPEQVPYRWSADSRERQTNGGDA